MVRLKVAGEDLVRLGVNESLATSYDDTELRERIEDLEEGKVDKVTGKGLSTNDYTDADEAEVAKIEGIEEDIDSLDLTKANIDGYYDTLSVGLADNLIDRKGNGTPQEISYRTSCGDDSIADDGNGIIQSIFGKTVVWNQLVNIITATETRNGITFTWDSQSQTLTMNGSNSTTVDYSKSTLNLNTKLGHIYLAVPYIVSGTYTSGSCRISLGADYTAFAQSVSDSGKIVTASRNTTNAGVNIVASADSTFDNLKIKYRIHDLTQLFGSGNEPTSLDDPRIEWIKDYATAHPEYNSGELISYNGSGIKTVGFNQWDEEWELGTFNTTTGANAASSSQIRSKNLIPILPNTTYYFKTANNYAWVIFLDADKNVIEGYYVSTVHDGNSSTLSDGTFVTPPNGAYMKFYMLATYGTTYNHDININLSWSGYRNGEYEPYWSRTLELPISTYFADGMKSAGSVRDELTKDKASERIGKVDLGTLESYAYGGLTPTDSRKYYAFNTSSVDMRSGMNFLCSEFSSLTWDELVSKDGAFNNWSSKQLIVSTTKYLTLDAFQTAMQGKYLYYELATPIETTITPPLDLTYKVADFGTEESVAEGKSTPFNGIIKYSDDFTRGLVNMPKNYDTTASLDALATSLSAMLTSALDGTVTITRGAYDSTNKKYAWNCSFTPNA